MKILSTKIALGKKMKVYLLTFLIPVFAFELSSDLLWNQNTYRPDSLSYQASMGVSLKAIHKLDDKIIVGGSLSAQKEMTQKRKFYWDNSFIFVNFLNTYIYDVQGSVLLGGVLPLAESNKKSSFKTALVVKPSLSKSFNKFNLGLGLKLVKSFHQFRQSASGSANTSLTLAPEISLSYQYKNLGFSLYGANNMSWTYDGSRKDDVYSVGQEVSISLLPKTSLSLNHEINRSLLGADGLSEWEVISEENSQVSLKLTQKF